MALLLLTVAAAAAAAAAAPEVMPKAIISGSRLPDGKEKLGEKLSDLVGPTRRGVVPAATALLSADELNVGERRAEWAIGLRPAGKAKGDSACAEAFEVSVGEVKMVSDCD